jgi:hypothetical protein
MADITNECYNDVHLRYAFVLAIPMLLLWGVILPGYLVYFLILKKGNLRLISMRIGFGFLYENYKNNFCIWEMIKIFMKMILILSVNLLNRENLLMNQFCLFIIFTYLIALMRFKPIFNCYINNL